MADKKKPKKSPLKEYVIIREAETAANAGRNRTDIPNPFSPLQKKKKDAEHNE